MFFNEVSVSELHIAIDILKRLHNQTFQAARPYINEKDIMSPRLPEAKESILKCIEILQANVKRKNILNDIAFKWRLFSIFDLLKIIWRKYS